MSSNIKISLAKGDGIGPEIMDAVITIFNAAGVKLDYDVVEMGKDIFLSGHSTGMTPAAQQSIEGSGILFKGPMETPKGKGVKSINVTARKLWSTYANVRRVQTLPGVDTLFSKAGIPIDITIIRENIEDTYGGIEHLNTQDVALCRRFITRPGSEQVHRFAFAHARKNGIKKVACGHKANIMKLTDGMFLETFYEIAKEYPEIEAYDIIVDDLCMKLASRPQIFEMIVLPNLQGDIVSDLCAGLVGGLGFAPSANIGDHICIFEAVHGTAPDITGKNIANPTALLLSGLIMLRHLGLNMEAANIENALRYTLESGVHTGDFGNAEIPASNTTEFAQAIISNLGKKPAHKPMDLASVQNVAFSRKPLPPETVILHSGQREETQVVGADIFVEAEMLSEKVAAIINDALPVTLEIQMISNRGTQVWPKGSILTDCVNHYRVRVVAREGEKTNQAELFVAAGKIAEKLYVTSFECLRMYGDKPGFSLAQGQ